MKSPSSRDYVSDGNGDPDPGPGNNTPDGLKSNVPFASFSRASKIRISSPLGTHAVLQMEQSHHILNRYQSLYRRVFFLSGSLCLCVHYTRRHLL